MEINRVTGEIFGGALENSRLSGPVLLELDYEACLSNELKNAGVTIEKPYEY
jgi:hypothetical protein